MIGEDVRALRISDRLRFGPASKIGFAVVASVAVGLVSGLASAESPMRLSDFSGTWDVIVHGLRESRFLEIMSPPEVAGAEAITSARYDITGYGGALRKVTARVAGDTIERITFTTQADTLVDVVPVTPSRLSGTFTVKGGRPRPVTFWRRPPVGDVPTSRLAGAWHGTWRAFWGSAAEARLTVVHADATAASFRYESDAFVVATGQPVAASSFWGTGEVDRGGRMNFAVGPHNWTFKPSGDNLAGSQDGPGYTHTVLMGRTAATDAAGRRSVP